MSRGFIFGLSAVWAVFIAVLIGVVLLGVGGGASVAFALNKIPWWGYAIIFFFLFLMLRRRG